MHRSVTRLMKENICKSVKSIGHHYSLTLLHSERPKLYRISSVIRQSFFSFQNNPKDLDPSCKTDLDLWDCSGRVKLVL